MSRKRPHKENICISRKAHVRYLLLSDDQQGQFYHLYFKQRLPFFISLTCQPKFRERLWFGFFLPLETLQWPSWWFRAIKSAHRQTVNAAFEMRQEDHVTELTRTVIYRGSICYSHRMPTSSKSGLWHPDYRSEGQVSVITCDSFLLYCILGQWTSFCLDYMLSIRSFPSLCHYPETTHFKIRLHTALVNVDEI